MSECRAARRDGDVWEPWTDAELERRKLNRWRERYGMQRADRIVHSDMHFSYHPFSPSPLPSSRRPLRPLSITPAIHAPTSAALNICRASSQGGGSHLCKFSVEQTREGR